MDWSPWPNSGENRREWLVKLAPIHFVYVAPTAKIIEANIFRNINWSMDKIIAPTIEQLSIPKHEYTSIKAYNISKLCGILAMHYLGYRWLNTNKKVFCAHPGSFVKTRLCGNWWIYEALYTSMLPFSKTVVRNIIFYYLCLIISALWCKLFYISEQCSLVGKFLLASHGFFAKF